MGEEFATKTPFLFFCDFGPELAAKVRDGRRAEFSRFEQFRSPQAQSQIPDPNLVTTFLHSKLDWHLLEQPWHQDWLAFYRQLLALRHKHIVPRIKDIMAGRARYEVLAASAIHTVWETRQGKGLELFANISGERVPLKQEPQGSMLYSTAENRATYLGSELPPFSAAWLLTA
jgi:maltooligosyltrehalose trehalohydrolase